MDSAPILQVEGLTVARGGRTILSAIDLSVRAGEIWALLGPNGAGKSTLLKAVAGLLPFEGTIRAQGHDARALSPSDRAKCFAYVPQHSALEAPMRAREVVAQGRFMHQGWLARESKADAKAVDEALERTRASHLADRAFSRLSYGERRLVLVARALATAAPILLLDEPTAALDVRNALDILDVLSSVARAGHAIVVALHQLDEAHHIASHALLLRGGKSDCSGTSAEVITPGPIGRVYGVELVPNGGFAYRRKDVLP